MKINKLTKWHIALLLVFIAALPLCSVAYGYWVNRLQTDCTVTFKHDVEITVTGLTSEEHNALPNDILSEFEENEPTGDGFSESISPEAANTQNP